MRATCRVVPVLLAALSLAMLIVPIGVQSIPLYAARQGLMCSTCHFDPNGGGPRNEFGFGFAKNRHLITPEDSTSRWTNLDLTNRVGERMPLYFGVNQRFMLLSNQHQDAPEPQPERLGFYNMESSIHFAFQPHDRLTLVYTLDGFASTPSNIVRSKEAFGMISGLPGNGYVKAGRIRSPYGLRMDDHTVATRNGFGDFGTGGPYLPYDPRQPDMGIEVGADHSNWFGRAAFTNGQSSPLGPDGFAEAKTGKIGYHSPRFQVAASIYDDFQKSGSQPQIRYTRWGAYGMTHYGPLALLGEIGAGTDEFKDYSVPPTVSSTKQNLLAWFLELDWSAARQYNVRGRYDYSVLDRDSDPAIREASTFSRYALEGEWVPVPFAELRLALRWLDPKDPALNSESQAYLQFHFSY